MTSSQSETDGSTAVAVLEPTSIRRLSADPLEHQGQRVITLRMMDDVHGRIDGAAIDAFGRHRGRLLDGVDYFDVPYVEWSQWPNENRHYPESKGRGGYRGSLVLLTETGYLLLVKTFTDDVAWEVQRTLIKHYFRSKSLQTAQQVIDYSPIAKIITDGLMPVVQGIADGVDARASKLERKFDEFKQEVKQELAQHVKRLEPTKDTKRRHLDAIGEFGGRCPCCSRLEVVTDSLTRAEGADYDHYFAPNRRAVNETWLVCRECNQRLKGYGAFWRDARPQFDSYQARRELYERDKEPRLPFRED